MVHPDPFDHNSTESNTPKAHVRAPALASPQDRLAATVVDYLIMVPLMSLVLAPWKRVLQADLVMGDDFYFHFQTILALILLFLAGVLYQATFLWFRGATPGKRLLRLEVISIWPRQRLTFSECLLRSVVWWIEVLLCGLPFLAVFSNYKRRPFHDRISDTVVVTHRWYGVRSPSIMEKGIAKGAVHAVVVFLILLGGFNAYQTLRELHKQMASSDSLASDDCSEESGMESSSEAESAGQKLEREMGLFAVGQAATNCLEKAADQVLAENPDSGLGYLGKSFALASVDAAQSDKYLDEVCKVEKGSQGCEFSRIVSTWNKSDWREISDSLRKLLPKSPDYIKFWAVRHFFKIRDYTKVLEILQSAPMSPTYANFVLENRFKSLLALGQVDQAHIIFETHIEHLTDDQKLEPASWMCNEELSDSCGAVLPLSCKVFSDLIRGHEEEMLTTSNLALTDIRIKSCDSEEETGIDVPYVHQLPQQAQLYIEALKLHLQNKTSPAKKMMEKLAESPKPSVINIEARVKLISWASSTEDFSKFYDLWKREDPFSAGWVREGKILMKKFSSLKNYSESFNAGMDLYEHNVTAPEFLRFLIVASYKSNHLQEAMHFWHQLPESEFDLHAATGRAPASFNELPAFQSWMREHEAGL